MLDPIFLETYLSKLSPEELRRAFLDMLPQGTREEREASIAAALASPAGRAFRAEMGRWIVDRLLPVDHLVPETYAAWRPPVRDAMLFVVGHLSDARLAPKLLEQLELPPSTPPEERLLLLIAKVPGLQKLGQVLARNQHLRPALREALSRLENGIHDVKIAEVRGIIQAELGEQLKRFSVKIAPRILCEASVSAVVRFTARDPWDGTRERGVFKVLKPYIPACFAEDMAMLQELSHYFGHQHRRYGPAARLIPDTFTKVRRLLQHEVDFLREQKTLLEADALYRDARGVHVPRVIRPLCTSTITAITEERGTKVTHAAKRLPIEERGRVADELVEALVAVPLFASGERSMFHADPHAGNLLYNHRTGELVIIDWALREYLTRDQRRQLALLFLSVALRDPVAATQAIGALAERRPQRASRQARLIATRIREFLDGIPLLHVPTAVDAMRLLEKVAYQGIRFPSPLIMLSKVLFTLDGILKDIGGDSATIGVVMARHLGRRLVRERSLRALPLRARDLAGVHCGALLFGGRLAVRAEQSALERLLRAKTPQPVA